MLGFLREKLFKISSILKFV